MNHAEEDCVAEVPGGWNAEERIQKGVWRLKYWKRNCGMTKSGRQLNKNRNYIFPFFWQNGADEQTLQTNSERKFMKATSGRSCVEARPHPDYAGERWWHDIWDIIMDFCPHS